MIRVLVATAFILVASTTAQAQSVAPIDALFRVLGLPDTIEIMREEGIGYATELQSDLLAGRGGSQWSAMVEAIYDVDRMKQTVRRRMDSELAAEDLAPMIAFFDSDRGRDIVALEVSARRALLDISVEEASREALQAMIADEVDRFELLEDFAEASDLVENNVAGAMNSNYALYVGLAEGGAFPGELSEEQILDDVWGQEAAIRLDTEEWLYSYLAMAYQPLTDDDLRTYTAFFHSSEGKVLNRAIFAAFDEMFVALSLALGQAASHFLIGEEL